MCECDHIPGFWGGLPGAIVAGAGGVMLVGGLATRSPHQVPGFFLVPLIFFENRSFVDFEEGHESVGGDLEEHGHFQIKKCVAR